MRSALLWLTIPAVLSLHASASAQVPEPVPPPVPPPPPVEPVAPVQPVPAPVPDPPAPPPAPPPDATADIATPPAPAPAAVATAPAAEVVADDGAASDVDLSEVLVMRLGPLRLAPIVLLQAQATPYVGDDALFQSGDIAEQGGFRLRYARIGLDAAYENQARLRFSTDLAGTDDGEVRVHDAFIAFTPFEWAGIAAGAQAVPLSRFELIRSGRGALIERPLASRALAPGNQVGLVGSGELWEGALSYSLGVFNGLQRSNLFYEGWAENYAPFGNRFDGLAYAVRLGSDPIERLPHTAADEDKGPIRIGVGTNYVYSDGGARDVHLGGGDVHLMWRGLHVIGEALWMRTVPESDPTQAGVLPFELTSWGIVGEAGYMIFERMLGAAARFEWIDPNTQSDDEADNWLITGGAHFHFVDQLLKLQAEYTHREERHGLSLKNDSVTLSLQGMLDPARPHGKETR